MTINRLESKYVKAPYLPYLIETRPRFHGLVHRILSGLHAASCNEAMNSQLVLAGSMERVGHMADYRSERIASGLLLVDYG